MNFETLTDDISAAAQRALEEVVAEFGAEAIAGFALYSDAGAMGVSPAFNTRANLSRNVRTDPGDAAYYRWSPGEWDLESRGIAHFESLNKRIRAAVAAVSPETFAQFRARLFNACVEALQRVKHLPRFADALRGAAIVFAVTEFEDPSSEKAWNAILNKREDADEFCRWLDSLLFPKD